MVGYGKIKTVCPSFFAENSIMSNLYLNILELFLEPQLQDGSILDTIVFQHNGASPHFAHNIQNYLKRIFPWRWINRGVITTVDFPFIATYPLDFFAWRYIKSKE